MAHRSSKLALADTTADAPVSKVDAVRAALAEGAESPGDGTGFIKSRFGLDMTRQHFSAVKSQLRKREGSVRGVGRPAMVRPASGLRKSSPGEPGLIESLELLKPLVAEHGAEKLKRLVDILG